MSLRDDAVAAVADAIYGYVVGHKTAEKSIRGEAEAALDALGGFLQASPDFAVKLAQVVHDGQDEYGHETRHDIGLVVADAVCSVLVSDVEAG